MTDVERLKREVAAIQWWHTIDLGDGIVTPGIDPTPRHIENLSI